MHVGYSHDVKRVCLPHEFLTVRHFVAVAQKFLGSQDLVQWLPVTAYAPSDRHLAALFLPWYEPA